MKEGVYRRLRGPLRFGTYAKQRKKKKFSGKTEMSTTNIEISRSKSRHSCVFFSFLSFLFCLLVSKFVGRKVDRFHEMLFRDFSGD